MLRYFCFIIPICIAVASSADDAFFEKQVRPLLVKHCYKCHSGLKTNGGLALDTRLGWQIGGQSGPAIVPGDPDQSLLIRAIKHESLEMPPEGQGEQLSDAEISTLIQWVKLGASDPRNEAAKVGGMTVAAARTWWAFQPLPPVDAKLDSQSVDDFIDAAIARQSLAANLPADRRTLIRRATYDLTGLPPTPQEVDHFLADQSADAFAQLVERLLDSPQYGVKWGRHWLDVVRYADTAGENTDRPLPHAWRYRNWVIDAINRDLPYDQFVRLQLAGDIIHDAVSMNSSDRITATGYLAIARRFGHDIDHDIHLMYEDVIDNVGKNFLGLSIGCARCHDHKYDPVTAEDYYALYGIFSSTRFAFPGCEAKGQPKDLVPLIPQIEADALTSAWRERSAMAEAEKKSREDAVGSLRNRAKESTAKSTRLLAEATVAKAGSVSFPDSTDQSPIRVAMRKGEVLQLIVSPNGNHGADSTLVEWEISQLGAEGHQWNVSELIPELLEGNPHASHDGASWCFLDVTEGPNFLSDKKSAVEGQSDLNSWSSGDLPSVFVNRSDQAIGVWTSLPPKSFFVHPGIERKVAVAWVCPIDGMVDLVGRVADAHPSGGNGVSYRLEHIASADVGPALIELGSLITSPAVTVEPAPTFPVAYAVAESTPTDAHLHTRGDPEKPGDLVPRRWLSVFGGEPIPRGAGSGRRQLADNIAQHPLAARVMVNRIWHWHFGRGLVASPNDFGWRGQPASHPQLLDWLAARFRDSGYSLKAMHRMIMNSAAYQRDSSVTESSASLDADNQYLSRFARRRLTAEEIRDSLLWVAGRLDPTPAAAHPFPPEATWKFTQHDPFSASYQTNRRSAYMMVARQRRDPYLAAFDGADPNASTAVRQTTTVPTQALYFMNAPLLHQQAAGFAQRVMSLPDQSQRIGLAFRLLFQRAPTTAEHQQATMFLNPYPGSREDKWSAYARVLIASNEFLYLD